MDISAQVYLLIEHVHLVVFRKVIGEVSTTEDDDDVDNERKRVINGDADSECLRLVNLTKVRNVTCY